MKKVKENPFIPVGAAATAGCLAYGVFQFVKGNSKKQQVAMRARVFAQGATLIVLVGGAMYISARDGYKKR